MILEMGDGYLWFNVNKTKLAARTSGCKTGIDLQILYCHQSEKVLGQLLFHLLVHFVFIPKTPHSLTDYCYL